MDIYSADFTSCFSELCLTSLPPTGHYLCSTLTTLIGFLLPNMPSLHPSQDFSTCKKVFKKPFQVGTKQTDKKLLAHCIPKAPRNQKPIVGVKKYSLKK